LAVWALPKFILTNYRPMSAKDIAAAVIAAAQTALMACKFIIQRTFYKRTASSQISRFSSNLTPLAV